MNTNDLIFTLKNDISAEVIQQIRNDKTIYQDFKQSVINSFANKIFDENLMGFALLTALNFDDNEFIEMLSNHFDFDDDKYNFKHKRIRSAWIAFAKAYVCLKNSKRDFAKAIFWRIFAEVSPDYFNKNDFLLLVNLLTEYNEIQNCDLLIQYCLLKFNNDSDFKIKQAQSQIINENNNTIYKNNHNTNIDFLLKNLNNATELQNLYNMCFFTFAEENNFYKFSEKAIMNLKYSEFTDSKENKFLYAQHLRISDVNEIIDILENAGEKPFLCDGTLLGLYRSGQLMSYDADADLGLLIDDEKRKNIANYVRKIRDCIQKNSNNKFTTALICYEQIASSIVVVNTKLKTHVDLEFFHKHYFDEDFKDVSKCFLGGKSKLSTIIWEFDDFNLTRKNLASKDYWVPENPEYFLEQLYGKDWKIPNSLWISMLSCPNLSEKSKLYVFYFGINYLFEYLRKNNYEKSNYIYKELQRWEYPFTLEMKNHIENYLEQIKTNEK